MKEIENNVVGTKKSNNRSKRTVRIRKKSIQKVIEEQSDEHYPSKII
jgi:hypothetical protein